MFKLRDPTRSKKEELTRYKQNQYIPSNRKERLRKFCKEQQESQIRLFKVMANPALWFGNVGTFKTVLEWDNEIVVTEMRLLRTVNQYIKGDRVMNR